MDKSAAFLSLVSFLDNPFFSETGLEGLLSDFVGGPFLVGKTFCLIPIPEPSSGWKFFTSLLEFLFCFWISKQFLLEIKRQHGEKRKETAPAKTHHQTYKKGLIENFRCWCHSLMERKNLLNRFFFKKEKHMYMNRCTDIAISTGFMRVSACLHHAWQQFWVLLDRAEFKFSNFENASLHSSGVWQLINASS